MNALTVSEIVTISPDEGFYNFIYSSLSPNGKLVIADVGNFTIHVFNTNSLDFKEIKQFGREGSGPGEFEGLMGVSASSDRIYIKS